MNMYLVQTNYLDVNLKRDIKEVYQISYLDKLKLVESFPEHNFAFI